jgi:hypothetical protein
MEIIASIFLAGLLCLLIFKWSIFKKLYVGTAALSSIFLIKILFGIAFYLVYTKYYSDRQTSDMHKYFRDAQKIYSLTADDPLTYLSVLSGIDFSGKKAIITGQLDFWDLEESASVINDSRMIIRFNLLLLPLSRGNIFIHLVAIVFLSFLGLFYIYKSFEKYFPNKAYLLLMCCFGVPSVMFWSSGIMKEGLLIFFTGIFTYHIFKKSSHPWLNFVFIAICFLGILFAKFYVAMALIPSLIFLGVSKIFKQRTVFANLVFSLTISLGSGFILNEALDNVPLKKLAKKQNDFINLSLGGTYLKNTIMPFDTIFTLQNSDVMISPDMQANQARIKRGAIYHHWKNPGYADTLIASGNEPVYEILSVLPPTGSAITLRRLMPTYSSMMQLLPSAVVNVFFRPFIFDVENLFSLLACIENLLIMILILSVCFVFKRPSKETAIVIMYALLFVFTLYTLVGLTTPVLGAAVRYKVPVLPFLLMSIFLLHDSDSIRSYLKFFSKHG